MWWMWWMWWAAERGSAVQDGQGSWLVAQGGQGSQDWDGAGVVLSRKVVGCRLGVTDERITPELFLVWLRCSAVPTRQSRASRKAGRPGPGQGIPRYVQERPSRSRSVWVPRPRLSVVQAMGGWEDGMSELAGGREAGRWTLDAGGVCPWLRSARCAPGGNCRR